MRSFAVILAELNVAQIVNLRSHWFESGRLRRDHPEPSVLSLTTADGTGKIKRYVF
jgi:hypothetical protein